MINMKFKTVIEDRFPKKVIKKKKNKLVIALLMFIQELFNTILPFTLGVYFGITRHIFFLILFLFPLLLEIRVTIDNKNNINLEIIRGF